MAKYEHRTSYVETLSGQDIIVQMAGASLQVGCPESARYHDSKGVLLPSHALTFKSENPLPSLGLVFSQCRVFDEALVAALERPGGGVPARASKSPLFGPFPRLRGFLQSHDKYSTLSKEGSLVRALKDAAGSGPIFMEPSEEDVFFPHAMFSLEPLIVGIDRDYSGDLKFTEDYKTRLREIAEGIFLEDVPPVLGAHPTESESPQKLLNRLEISPKVRVEPAPTVYLRLALLYRRVHGHLKGTLDGDTRLFFENSDITDSRSLGDALEDQVRLYAGLHLISCVDIGSNPSPLLPGALPEENWSEGFEDALKWLEDPLRDPAAAGDSRALIVLSPPGSSMFDCAVMMGMEIGTMTVAFRRPPELEIKEPDQALSRLIQTPRHVKRNYSVSKEIWAGVQIKNPPTRSELLRLCEAKRSREAILDALK